MILLTFDMVEGKYAGVSYGETKTQGKIMRAILDDIFDSLFTGELDIGGGFKK